MVKGELVRSLYQDGSASGYVAWDLRTKDNLAQILSRHTGQPIDRVKQDTERDNFMTAAEAVEYGLVDEVIERKEQVVGPR